MALILALLGSPGVHFWPPGPSWGSFWVSWVSFWASFGSPGALLALLGPSGDPKMIPKWLPKMTPKWLPGGLPEGSRNRGTLFCENPTGMHTGAEFSKTWLSWNGKRERRESIKHCKRSKSRKSSGEEEEQEQRHREQQDRKRSQSIPSCKPASLGNRGWALARALRARARPFGVGASRSFLAAFLRKRAQRQNRACQQNLPNDGSQIVPKSFQNGSIFAPESLPERLRGRSPHGARNFDQKRTAASTGA